MYKMKSSYRDLPAGCVAGIIADGSNATTMVVVDPEKFRGKIFQVKPNPIADLMEEQPDSVLDHVFLRKDHRKRGTKIYGEDTIEARVIKRRHVKTPYPVGSWYISRDPDYPVFFLVRFDHSNFVIRKPEADPSETVNLDWQRVRRADPKRLTLEMAQSLGLNIKPEEFQDQDRSRTRGLY
jgi:hypothetical protein